MHLQQGFGGAVGQGPHALAAPCSQHHGLRQGRWCVGSVPLGVHPEMLPRLGNISDGAGAESALWAHSEPLKPSPAFDLSPARPCQALPGIKIKAQQAGTNHVRWLIENGINEKYGARPLLALMSRELEGALGRELIVRPVGTKIKGRFVPQTATQALKSRLELKASAKLYTSEEA